MLPAAAVVSEYINSAGGPVITRRRNGQCVAIGAQADCGAEKVTQRNCVRLEVLLKLPTVCAAPVDVDGAGIGGAVVAGVGGIAAVFVCRAHRQGIAIGAEADGNAKLIPGLIITGLEITGRFGQIAADEEGVGIGATGGVAALQDIAGRRASVERDIMVELFCPGGYIAADLSETGNAIGVFVQAVETGVADIIPAETESLDVIVQSQLCGDSRRAGVAIIVVAGVAAPAAARDQSVATQRNGAQGMDAGQNKVSHAIYLKLT